VTHVPAAPLSSRLERLVEAGLVLTTELSLQGVLQRVADLAMDLLEAKYAAIGVLGPDGRTLVEFVTAGIEAKERARIGRTPEGRGILGLVIREGHPIRLENIGAHPEAAGFPQHHPPMKSFLGVPMVGRSGVFGNLYITDKRTGPAFSDADVRVATLLAAQAAAAVENARLHEQSARLLEEVQQLQRSRERFFATVNHELRNALAGVYGWAEMLVRKREIEAVPRAAFEVLESAEHAVALVNDLLDLSRLDEDRLQPRFAEIDATQVIRRAVGLTTPAATEHEVRIAFTADPRFPRCYTDAHRLEQILVNLITNAIRHSPTGTQVEVQTGPGKERASCRITVGDRGPGIPPEERERVFDIYATRLDDAPGGGTGLGLPLSRRLARLLQGDLWAEERPGGGARLVLELPTNCDRKARLKNPS